MIGRNIKKYRLMHGLSMRDMGEKIGVSHETIKKYEDEVLTPNSTRLIQIAKLFGIKTIDLVNSFDVPQLQFKNFRKSTSLTKRKQDGLFMLISDEIAKYIEILNLSNENYLFDKEKWTFKVQNEYDLENIASTVRQYLGSSDICALDNLVDKLEDNNFLILEINYDENFDGFCEYVDKYAFIILSSRGYERNRFTLAHELAHLILKFDSTKDNKEIEEYCNIFASCLLMPKKAMKNELQFNGLKTKRNVSLNEVLLLAKEYKVSPNAIIMRLYTLDIISETKKKELFITLTKMGYRTKQLKMVEEHPTKQKKIIFRLEAEKIINNNEAINYLGVTSNEYFKSDFCN